VGWNIINMTRKQRHTHSQKMLCDLAWFDLLFG